MTIYPVGPDTYRAEWPGGYVVAAVDSIKRCDVTEWYVHASDGAWPDRGLEGVLKAAILNLHLDRLASQDPT